MNDLVGGAIGVAVNDLKVVTEIAWETTLEIYLCAECEKRLRCCEESRTRCAA